MTDLTPAQVPAAASDKPPVSPRPTLSRQVTPIPGTKADEDDSTPKILIPEKVSAEGLSVLSDFTVHQPKTLSATDLLSIIPSYHALIVRSETKVTAEVLAAGKKLKVVARAGVGVDNIDVDAATKHGIIVVNSPSGNIAAAAEHTIALLMAVARNVPAGDRSLRSGQWARSKLVGTEVGGKTLGVIGLGKVGMKVARMAIGLGMRVLAMDPYASPDLARTNNVALVENLNALLPAVDFLSIHTPLIASTLDLISSAEFAKMKPTAKVLNVARGGVYNEQALLEALDYGTIAGAALDVFTSEPPAPDSAAHILTQHPKVVVTPHLGASTVEAQENVSNDVCNQVSAILSGGMPTSAVNAPIILPEEYRKLQPFVRLIEKMGSLYTQHFCHAGRASLSSGAGGGSLGGKTFELIYEGELASMTNTRPLLAALIKGLTATISEGGGRDVNMVNAPAIARQRGMVIDEIHARVGGGDLVYASLVTLRVSSAGPGAPASRSRASSPYTRDADASSTATPTATTTLSPKQASENIASQATATPGTSTTATTTTLLPLDTTAQASSTTTPAPPRSQIISGFVSGRNIYISRLDRFETNFTPEGRLVVLHNYDEPGKIGGVGSILGRHGINIRFMAVASLEGGRRGVRGSGGAKGHGREEEKSAFTTTTRVNGNDGSHEALMILGVDGEVKRTVVDELEAEKGILDVSVVEL